MTAVTAMASVPIRGVYMPCLSECFSTGSKPSLRDTGGDEVYPETDSKAVYSGLRHYGWVGFP